MKSQGAFKAQSFATFALPPVRMNYLFKLLLVAFSLSYLFPAWGQSSPPPAVEPSVLNLPQLGPGTEISLITYTPGDELYQTFGHSAIRIRDASLEIDRLYNYGTFDFETPNFALQFAHGDLRYQLMVTPGAEEIESVIAQFGQGVSEVPLNFSVNQKQQLFAFLENNLLPENRFYRYDFALDNCSTRIRDAFERITGSRIEEKGAGKLTFRQMLDVDFSRTPWVHFGVDLLLGSTMDRLASPREACFLPADLERAVQSSMNGENKLGGPKRELSPPEPLPQPFWLFSPLALFSGIGFGWFLFWLLRGRRHARWLTAIYLTVFGAAGVFVCFMSFWSLHWVLRANYNQLWLIPTHLVAGLWLFFAKPKLLKAYLWGALIAALLFLFFPFLIPQVFHPAVFPLVAILAWRCAVEIIPNLSRASS